MWKKVSMSRIRSGRMLLVSNNTGCTFSTAEQHYQHVHTWLQHYNNRCTATKQIYVRVPASADSIALRHAAAEWRPCNNRYLLPARPTAAACGSQMGQTDKRTSDRYTDPTPHTMRAHSHTFNGPFPGLPRWAGTRKVKQIWILLKQR